MSFHRLDAGCALARLNHRRSQQSGQLLDRPHVRELMFGFFVHWSRVAALWAIFSTGQRRPMPS